MHTHTEHRNKSKKGINMVGFDVPSDNSGVIVTGNNSTIIHYPYPSKYKLLAILFGGIIIVLVGLILSEVFKLSIFFQGIFPIVVMMVVIGFIKVYLEPPTQTISNSNLSENLIKLQNKYFHLEEQNNDLNSKLDEIIESMQKLQGDKEFFDSDDKAFVLSQIQKKLESNTLKEYTNQLTSQIEEKLTTISYDKIFEKTSLRLENEIQNQTRKGTVNLLIGITITAVGAWILFDTVINAPNVTSTLELVSYFIPKVSLVILIEIFAYFFLKLYKHSLIEIKYFQNELTNIENKYLGIKLIKDEKSLNEAVSKLLSTEPLSNSTPTNQTKPHLS